MRTLSGKYPPEALNASRRKTRARKSSVLMEGRSARVNRSITQRGKGTDRPLSGAIASSPNSDTNKTKYKYSTERRQSKTNYRRQHTQMVEKGSPSPSQAYYVDQRPYNGYATPRSDELRTRRSTIKELCKGSTKQRCYKLLDNVSDG